MNHNDKNIEKTHIVKIDNLHIKGYNLFVENIIIIEGGKTRNENAEETACIYAVVCSCTDNRFWYSDNRESICCE